MTVCTFSQARQRFVSVLERARREGAVWVKRRDGQVFLIPPERSHRSPLDWQESIPISSSEEIVDIVREMRQRVNVPRLRKTSGRAAGKRATKKVR